MKTYAELIKHIIKEQQADRSYAFRMEIASAVLANISIKDMTDQQINALCLRISVNLLECDDEWPDIDEVCYRIEKLLEDGEYEEPNDECVKQAFADCNQ